MGILSMCVEPSLTAYAEALYSGSKYRVNEFYRVPDYIASNRP